MAHQILPQHRPHEQLRTEAPTQKAHTDKYVSAFASSENYIDMSFQNPILQESADHFRVGIDELTVNLSNLSMLEYNDSDVLFQFRRLGYFGDVGALPENINTHQPAETFAGNLATHRGLPTASLATATMFKINHRYNTLAEIMERAKEVCRALGSFIKETGLIQPGPYNHLDATSHKLWNKPIALNDAAVGGVTDYIDVFLTAGGLLKFVGNKIFWSNFVIEIPDLKYRHLMLGADKQYISVVPGTGAIHNEPYDEDIVQPFADWANTDTAAWVNHENLTNDPRSFTGSSNLGYALDRRVALEVGCSLPVKNSPLFDHGAEAPDFVLGRYNIATRLNGSVTQSGTSIQIDLIHVETGPVQLMGPKDRVCYHHLGPQQKIQAIRLRLWARVRTYDAANLKWGMKTIQMPVLGSDYWHVKLHFRSK